MKAGEKTKEHAETMTGPFLLSEEERELLRDFRRYLDERDLSAITRETEETGVLAVTKSGPLGDEFMKQLAKDGWLGLSLPVEFGGGGRPLVQQWLVNEELVYRALPAGGLSLSAIAPTLAALGSDAQRAEFLPRMIAWNYNVVIGYTEAEAGSDLASLRTRAVPRAEGGFVISGEKLFTTGANTATHIWTAVRTDPTSERPQGGISIFLIPADAPGITISRLTALGRHRTNQVRFDDVVVSSAQVVGELNGGWTLVKKQLTFERLFQFSYWSRELEALIRALPPLSGADERHRLQAIGVAGARLHALRLLFLRCARLADSSADISSQAAMVKLGVSELRQFVTATFLELQGADAQLDFDSSLPEEQWAQRAYALSAPYKIGGGTSAVQRTIIWRSLAARYVGSDSKHDERSWP